MPSLSKPKIVNRGPAGLLSKDGSKLTNRGGAGLLAKAPPSKNGDAPARARPPKGPVDRIKCEGEVVPVSKLRLDPNNAKLHPELNLEHIEDSLNQYGQMSPITVRKQGMVVMKGNGTLTAAIRLGWTKIACSVIPMTDVEAAGYGVADNRSGEHGKWDFEVLSRIERMLEEVGQTAVGWTVEELAALRASQPDAPDDFPEVGEDIEVDHVCPRCGYAFSGGEMKEKGEAN